MMKWENLARFHCPVPMCEHPLIRIHPDMDIECTKCTFHIEPNRFKSIEFNRSHPERKKGTNHWENLKENMCPVCNQPLIPCPEYRGVTMCSVEPCPFRIGNASMQRILNNPEHSCNIFYNRIHNDEQAT